MKIMKNDYAAWRGELDGKLERLSRMKITVGVHGSVGGELLTIANVHEFGATIKPKKAKNLAIPLKPSMRGKSPREVSGNTFVLESDGNRFLVRDKGKDQIEFLFMLVPSVTIPERSFIRAGYDNNRDKLAEACQKAMTRVIMDGITVEQAADYIGAAAVSLVKRYMRTIMPKKSRITLASSPGKSTTLVQSGRLQNAITYEVSWL